MSSSPQLTPSSEKSTPVLAGYLDKHLPGPFETLTHYANQVVEASDEAGIPRKTLELMNFRASQINGCAFCLDLHHKRARKYGETEQRLALLSAHAESGLFTKEEEVALELVEEITNMSISHPSPELFDRARDVYTEQQIAVLCMAAIGINAFNRLSILSSHPVRVGKHARG